jgi:hypothetical protein
MSIPTKTRAHTANIAPFGLRMQPALRKKIEAEAGAAGRSVNAEIVARLEHSLEPSASQPQDQRLISSLHVQIRLLRSVIKHAASFMKSILSSKNNGEMTDVERIVLEDYVDDLLDISDEQDEIKPLKMVTETDIVTDIQADDLPKKGTNFPAPTAD